MLLSFPTAPPGITRTGCFQPAGSYGIFATFTGTGSSSAAILIATGLIPIIIGAVIHRVFRKDAHECVSDYPLPDPAGETPIAPGTARAGRTCRTAAVVAPQATVATSLSGKLPVFFPIQHKRFFDLSYILLSDGIPCLGPRALKVYQNNGC